MEGKWVPKKWQTLLLLWKKGVISYAGHPCWIKINSAGNRLENVEPFLGKTQKSTSMPCSIPCCKAHGDSSKPAHWKNVVAWGTLLHQDSNADTLVAKLITLTAQKGIQILVQRHTSTATSIITYTLESWWTLFYYATQAWSFLLSAFAKVGKEYGCAL